CAKRLVQQDIRQKPFCRANASGRYATNCLCNACRDVSPPFFCISPSFFSSLTLLSRTFFLYNTGMVAMRD
ncbi:MAG: hypothetical protein KDE29_21105, partial [Anaerolineales bacterium]|nr:hypothetical protein [Anaerolineales bacterium]